MPLSDYHAKRDFNQTPEPTGGQGSGPLRFVVQKHDASHLHYDFRLEMGGILKSWAVPKGPSLNPGDKRLAMMTEDHPYDYRTFEGVIPKGNYGAGSVIIWDEGTYEPLAWDEKTGRTLELSREEQDRHAKQAVHAGHLTFILHGEKLNGEFALIRMHHADEDNAWLLVKADKDRFVTDTDITRQAESVVTGRTVEEVAAGAPETKLAVDLHGTPLVSLPKDLSPMLATLSEQPFDDPDWLYEIKWDGYRILAHIAPDGIRLMSRNGQDYTKRFKAAADELHGLRLPAVIDGEMCVVDENGKPSFQALQNFMRTGRGGHLMYYAFDLLYLDGHDLTHLALSDRKDLLRRALPQGSHLKYSDHVAGQGMALLESVRTQGLEGLIAKRADSPYQPGKRSHDWLKLKTHRRQEAVIIGFTKGRGGRQHFGALVLGVYDKSGRLVYAGHTGSGFGDDQLAAIGQRLHQLETPDSPIQPAPKTNEPATWVKPELVAEIEFTEWTEDGSMRHPIFMGLRDDKPATAVTKEEVMTEPTVQITHPDKVYFPDDGITKQQVVDYYRSAATVMLPYLKDRPESLNRFPNGIGGESFYHKDLEDHPTWAKTVTVHSESAGKDIHYLLCNDEPTLIYMANLGCIDVNPWNSRTAHLDKPDWCVIDLDPEAVDFEAVVQTSQTVHEVLDGLDVPSYPKTSGATGIHIYIPMGARYGYEQVKLFAQLVAQLVHDKLPDLTSLERSPAKRQGKVYLDYLQNRHGQTLAAAYSVRPKPGATVSMPLAWDEVTRKLTPRQFTIFNAHERFGRDAELWRPVMGEGIDLPAVLGRIAQ